MKSLQQYAPVCAALTRAAFEARYPGPFFVHSTRSGGPLLARAGGRTIDDVVVGDSHGGEGAEVQSVFTVSQFASKAPPLRIGSDADASIRIPAASISRVHALLHPVGTGWAIEDAGSSLGTWLNGKDVEPSAPRPLNAGDRVSLGTIDLTFFSSGSFYEFVLSQGAR